jgi:hypothetical protein
MRDGKGMSDDDRASPKHFLFRLSDIQDTGVAAESRDSEQAGSRRVVIGESLKQVGEVDGAVVELTHRNVPLAVVSSGAVLGVGGTMRLVPLQALRMTESTTVLEGITADAFDAIEPVTEDQIKKLEASKLEQYYKPFGMRAPTFGTRTASRN